MKELMGLRIRKRWIERHARKADPQGLAVLRQNMEVL